MYFRWKPYLPAAKRRQKSERLVAKLTHCGKLLSPVTAARGAIDGLMAEILEEHVREYLLADEELPAKDRANAAEELIGIIHSYLT